MNWSAPSNQCQTFSYSTYYAILNPKHCTNQIVGKNLRLLLNDGLESHLYFGVSKKSKDYNGSIRSQTLFCTKMKFWQNIKNKSKQKDMANCKGEFVGPLNISRTYLILINFGTPTHFQACKSPPKGA